MRDPDTARINRDQLLGLLATMKPADQQPITTRALISDIEAELARQAARAKPRQVAALLPPCKVKRFPRATPLPTLGRTKTQRVEQVPPPMLSAETLAHLSADEIAMLPIEVRGMLPEVFAETKPACDSVEIHSVACGDLGHLVEVIDVVSFQRTRAAYFAILISCLTAAFLVCAAYLLA